VEIVLENRLPYGLCIGIEYFGMEDNLLPTLQISLLFLRVHFIFY